MKKLSFHIFLIVIISVVIAVILGINEGGYISNNVDWIGFIGTITGGIITLYGVWLTIKNQEEQRTKDKILRDQERREELSSQFKPILKIMMTNLDGKSSAYFDLNVTNGKAIFKIRLFNAGRGEALNIVAEVYDESLDYKILGINDHILFEKEYSNVIDSSLNSGKTLEIDMKLKYEDAFETKYLQTIKLYYSAETTAGTTKQFTLRSSKVIDYQEIRN